MSIKTQLFHKFVAPHLYKSVYQLRNPFKIFEFKDMVKDITFSPEDRILDVGSGHGYHTHLLGREAAYTLGIDPSADDVSRALSNQEYYEHAEKVHFKCATIEQAGLEDESFDKVFSVCVLEHIPDYMSTLRHAFRVLKKGGQLVFSVDCLGNLKDQELKALHKERYLVHRYFEKEPLKKDFESLGFTDVTVDALCVSDTAAEMFEEGIRREFAYRMREAWGGYCKLVKAEKKASASDTGIYLMVRARKPA